MIRPTAAVIVLSLGLLNLATVQAGPANNSLVIGASQEPPNIMDPWRTNNLGIATEVNGYMTARLVYLDNAGDLHPEIATRVPTLANGDYKLIKDGSGKVTQNSVTYTIRPEAKWSDGTAITSRDFNFWLAVMQDERVPVPTRLPWAQAKIKVVDDHRFTITYTPPYLFADRTSPGLAPAYAMEQGYQEFSKGTAGLDHQKDAEKISDAWKKYINQYTTVTNMPKLASGPFKPSKWLTGNMFEMVRNPHYWQQPAGGSSKYVQSVRYMFITDTNTLKLNVLSGKVDAVSAVGLTFDQAQELEKTQGKRYQVKYVNTGTWEQISVANMGERAKKLGLTDKRVRQALLYSLNREELTKALFGGKQLPLNTWVNPDSKLFKREVKPYPYDPAKARELFAAAGWKPGPDGILVKDGQRMVLKFTTTASNKIRERVQLIIKDQWKKVGVDVTIQNYPASVAFGNDFAKKADEGKWDLFMFAWGSDPILEDGTLWIGKEVPSTENGLTGSNYAKYKSAEYDALWAKADVEFDGNARIKLFDRMQAVWNEDLPVLPLYSRVDAYTRSPELVNFDFTANTGSSAWDAYQIGWRSLGAVQDKGK